MKNTGVALAILGLLGVMVAAFGPRVFRPEIINYTSTGTTETRVRIQDTRPGRFQIEAKILTPSSVKQIEFFEASGGSPALLGAYHWAAKGNGGIREFATDFEQTRADWEHIILARSVTTATAPALLELSVTKIVTPRLVFWINQYHLLWVGLAIATCGLAMACRPWASPVLRLFLGHVPSRASP